MLNATLTRRVNITETLVIFQVTPDSGVPIFLPGQYVALGLMGSAARFEGAPPERDLNAPDKMIKRTYSVSSSPESGGYFEFYIAIVPDGSLTSRLAALKEGDRLFVAPKVAGTFTLKGVPDANNLVFISTGTGIAPFMSMLRTKSTWSKGRKITLVNGVRYTTDFAYSDELKHFAEGGVNFSYFTTVSRPDSAWDGNKGYVQEFIKDGRLPLNPESDLVFLCGNPAMVEDVEGLLASRGYSVHSKKNPEGKLHVEKYW